MITIPGMHDYFNIAIVNTSTFKFFSNVVILGYYIIRNMIHYGKVMAILTTLLGPLPFEVYYMSFVYMVFNVLLTNAYDSYLNKVMQLSDK